MNKLKYFSIFIASIFTISCLALEKDSKKAPRKRILINKILARVNGANILLGDIEKQRLGNKTFTLEEIIDQELFLQESMRRKLSPTPLDIEKYIASVRSEYENQYGKLSDENFEKMLGESKFTLKTYKQELYRALSVSNLLGTVIREKVFVPSEEVEQYYKEHPEYSEALYLLKTCIVPFSKAKKEEDLNFIFDFNWIESGWMSKSQINENIRSITELKAGQSLKPIKTQYGFQLVKLDDIKESSLKTLQERYVDIEKKLKDQKMIVFEQKYADELKKRAIIEFLD